ncbi:MAG: hypothetical protein J6Q84_02715 [Kiritimatiellae bacterium]|nr:hypothetical protein [Kiritimatiellia bacterium]
MMFAEWSGHTVKVYRLDRTIMRTIRARYDVVSVQCSGEIGNGYIAITMVNGKTDVYHDNGTIYRQG